MPASHSLEKGIRRTTSQIFVNLPVRDPKQSIAVFVAKAVAAGGTADVAKDHGFMYEHGFQDPDGRNWGVFWMDVAAFEKLRQEAKP